MSIVDDRFMLLGTTEHDHEKQALEFVRSEFPSHDPYHARGLVDLLEAGSGRSYEIDLLVIGRHAIYLVEIKSHPGRIDGDAHAWRWTPGDGRRPRELDNPFPLANHKAKVLKSLLERQMGNVQVPWVQPLIFLSAEGVKNHLSQEGRVGVVTRESLLHAIQNGQFPGAPSWLPERQLNSPTAREVKRALNRLGLRPRTSLLKVGEYVLGPVIADGDGYQDRSAHHGTLKQIQCRARVYLVPDQTSPEHKQRLRRAAEREVQLLWNVRDTHGVLRSTYFAADVPVGPTLIFEDFDGAIRLDHFLLANPKLAFEDRLDIVRQVGHSLAGCHRRDVIHGGLSPEAVLVRRKDNKLETRLFNFQLGRSQEASATIHRSLFASRMTGAYQAPELAADPSAASRVSDVFSLGALMYFVFTGKAPADSGPELLKKLDRDKHLDPSAVADNLPAPVLEIVQGATYLASTERFDHCGELVELLVDELRTATEQAAVQPDSTAHVLEAETGDILAERFTVKKVLGHGASARVLHVEAAEAIDGRTQFALKASRGPEHDERIRQEGEQLRRLRHPRIVQCHDIVALDERTCLLLTIAGTRSLQQLLTEQGSLDLDLAARYGEDLLEALKELEDKSILHRDIKPANLGVGSRNNLAKHLTLFDFSLLSTSLTELDVGTPLYRDPFLPLRGAWDAAGDRWSAAVTLHEMLTGLRPRYGTANQSPLDPKAALRIESERFDAGVRDALTRFFERTLARDPAQRFESASLMLRAWSAVFESPAAETQAEAPRRRHGTQVELGAVTDEQITKIALDTPIRALPLSARAHNALDRAGLLHAKELLTLADNRLSAIRGIGRKVSTEILELRDRWRAHLDEEARAIEAEPFFPEFRGDELLLDGLELPDGTVAALADAGLHTTTVLARAPQDQVHAVLAREQVDPARVREVLSQLTRAAATQAEPKTLGAWLDVIFPRSKRGAGKGDERLLRFFGLAEPFVGRTDLTFQEAAEPEDITRQRLQQQYAKAIARWQGQAWREPLRALALAIVDELGHAAPLELAVQRLAAQVPDDLESAPLLRRARYATLLRVATELGPDEHERQVSLRRRERNDPRGKGWRLWLLSGDEQLWAHIKQLGDAADELAERQPLASSGEALRTLAPTVDGTPLALDRLGQDRLLSYAAAASHRAARSSRLELYPLGMPAQRALELSAQALTGDALPPEQIQARVRARYPEALPLPSRPELDALVDKLKLTWDADNGAYKRPGSDSRTSLHSSFTSLHRRHTAMPEVRSRAEASLEARDFEDAMLAVLQERKLRVLAANSHYLRMAIAELERVLGTRAVEVDRRLAEHMEAVIIASGGTPEVLWAVDAGGPEHPHWSRLLKVARTAAERLAGELLPSPEPLLLVQAGLLARYGLDDFVRHLVEVSNTDDSGAIVLLNPNHDGDRIDVINAQLPVGGLLPGQAARIPFAWLENRHRGASTEL